MTYYALIARNMDIDCWLMYVRSLQALALILDNTYLCFYTSLIPFPLGLYKTPK